MMKRLLGVLLALMLLTGGMGALAEDLTETATTGDLKITVVDMLGVPMAGVELTLYDATGTVVRTVTTDETGTMTALAVAAGTYRAKAIDPADGYSTLEWFSVPDTSEVKLTLRKLMLGTEVVVGTVTKPNGCFFTDMWGNNTSDIDIRTMLHGYQTVSWTTNLAAELDESIVTLDTVFEANNGNKTYTFTVRDGLRYNDGTPINARDFVFAILLQSSPQAVAIGAKAYGYQHLDGFEDFNTGDTPYFSGVRLLGDRRFSMEVSGDYLPYFYELVYLSAQPYPIGVIAPGCEVADDGEGALIRPLVGADGAPLGAFTADVLERTILDPETGYLSHPKVTSGPYQLVSYDRDTGTVDMLVNLNYSGNFEGQRPLVEKSRLVVVDKTDMLQRFAAGEIDILNKVTDIEAIDGAVALRDLGQAAVTTYLRSGQSFLGLACEQGPTSHQMVRQAIYHSLDQLDITGRYTGTYGLPVYSHYGLGQWMATGYINTMQEEVDTYAYDLEEAKKLILRDGWTLNENGTRFVEGVDTVRYRKLNGKEITAYNAVEDPIVACVRKDKAYYMPLELHFADIPESGLCALVKELLLPNLESLGFRIITEEISFTDMLRCYNRQDGRRFNLFALASNFTFVYDPYFEFSPEEAYQGSINRSGINDRDLTRMSKRLRETPPGEDEEYIARWLTLMKRYSVVLPTVPIYSNMYVDIEAMDIQGYDPNSTWSWPVALLYTYIGEPEEELLFTGGDTQTEGTDSPFTAAP